MSTRVKCSVCGKKTRHQDGICESCRVHAPVDSTETAIETETFKPVGFDNKNKESNIMKKVFDWTLRILGVAFLVALILFCGWLIRGCATTPASAPTTAPTAETSVFADDFSLNNPANPSDVNPNIWDEVYNDGVMVGEDGNVYYTQSGKDGAVLLHGKIEVGQTVVIDAYRLEKDGEIYNEGCLLVLNGPVDFDTNPIFYTNGAAQIIATENTQKFLDENVWLKFSRGDRLADDSAWSYKTWALSNIWLPDGITFKELGLTAETDIYPNK